MKHENKNRWNDLGVFLVSFVITLCGTLFLLFIPEEESVSETAGSESDLLILYTNQMSDDWWDEDSGKKGTIRTVKELKETYEAEGCLVVLAGAGGAFSADEVQNAQGMSEQYDAMADAGYDMLIPGKQELAVGVNWLGDWLTNQLMNRDADMQNFVVLGANIRLPEELPAGIYEEAGILGDENLMCGFTGAVTTQGQEALETGVEIGDPIEAIVDNCRDFQEYEAKTGMKLDEIVALVNLDEQGDYTAENVAARTDATIVIDGNCRRWYQEIGGKESGEPYVLVGLGSRPDCVGYVRVQRTDGVRQVSSGVFEGDQMKEYNHITMPPGV